MLNQNFWRKSFSVAVVLIAVGLFQILAQDNNRSDVPISEEHYEFLSKKKELIEKETASSKNEWYGAYQAGDHHPTVFMWTENEGFLTWGSHHTFSPSRINFGKAAFENNRLTIKAEIDKSDLHYQKLPSEFTAVKWGEQHFLIPPDELIDFAYAVHSGSEIEIEQYFIKSEDTGKDRKGLPDLPKEFERFLKMQSIKTKVTAVEEREDIWETKITLDKGSSSNIIKGMILYFKKGENYIKLVVYDVKEKSSAARINSIGGSEDDSFKPKIGMKFTSKAPSELTYY